MDDRTKTGPSGPVSLRPMTAADLPIFFEHQKDQDASRMAAYPTRDEPAFMAQWTKILADDAIVKRTVLVGTEVAGNIVSFVEYGEPQVGYWLGREFWGRGVATRALAAFLPLVATRPLYAHVARHNVASRRVLEKCGFMVCGEDTGFPSTSGEAVEEFVLRLEAKPEGARP